MHAADVNDELFGRGTLPGWSAHTLYEYGPKRVKPPLLLTAKN